MQQLEKQTRVRASSYPLELLHALYAMAKEKNTPKEFCVGAASADAKMNAVKQRREPPQNGGGDWI